MRTLLVIVYLFLGIYGLHASQFYLDPENGSISNDGSFNSPFPSFKEVIDAGLIESYSYSTPFSAQSTLLLKNGGAPIRSGDTLILLPGMHGDIFLRNYVNSEMITVIGSEDGMAILAGIRVQGGRNWRFENLVVSREPYGYIDKSHLIFMETHGHHGPVSNIEIRNCEVFSADQPWLLADEWITHVSNGIYMRGDSMVVEGNQLRNIDMGITAAGNFMTIKDNEVINFSGDGIRMLGSNIIVEANLIKNCYNVDDNHDDGIQSFTSSGVVFKNNVIRGNTILNFDDPDQPLLGTLQGIGCFDGFYEDWTIENNLVIVNHWHGITLLGARNCRIVNNTVLDPSPLETPGSSWIRIDDHKDGRPSEGCMVKNNVVNKLTVDAEESHNFILIDKAEYDLHFVDYAENDFQLVGTSTLIDGAEVETATEIDILGIARDQGMGPDVGAFEYVFTSSYAGVQLDEIEVFPNPARQQLFIKNLPLEGEIEVFNQVGLTVYMISSPSEYSPGFISNLPSGWYTLCINDRSTHSRKVVHFVKLWG